MKVTVVVPAYNCESTILKVLEGLQRQDTDEEFEVVIVDHSSSDSTCELVRKYEAAGRFVLTILQRPRGVNISAVRNHGAKVARGEVLAFIDSDCEPPVDWLTKGLDLLAVNGSSALVAGGCCPPPNGTWVESSWHSIRAGHKEGSVFVHGANFFIPKRIFDDMGGFDENLETSEDYDLGRRVSLRYKVVSVPQFTVVHYGEANTIRKRIAKERWYSRNMLDTLASNRFYKPFWISAAFVVSFISMCICAVLSQTALALLFGAGLLFLSVFLAFYFCYRAKQFSHFLTLIPICSAYLVGRSLGIVDILAGCILSKRCPKG